MNFRKRIVTLLAVSVIAMTISPLGAQAGRSSNPAVPPFSQTLESDWCSTQGTGMCTSDAFADRSGRVTGTSTSYVKEDRENGVTDTAYASSRGGVAVSFSLPRTGVSSVTFTVEAWINSASASRSNPNQPAWAEVYFWAYARSTSGNCTSCTVFVDHAIADSYEGYGAPASRTNENETFSFVLKSGNGDLLRGRVELSLRLAESTYVSETSDSNILLPILSATGPIEGSAVAHGDANIQKITAEFSP